MTEKKASREIYVFSKYLDEVYRLYGLAGNQVIFTMRFRSYLKRLIEKLKDATFDDLQKYRNANCASNCLPGHSIRCALLAMAIAKELSLKETEITEIGVGALLHDIGKLFIPREILDKPCKLSETEFEVIKNHSEIGFQVLKNQKWLPQPCIKIVHNHHERLDGSGYPNQLSGNQIHRYERIVGVADVFDAMTSKRNYREALSYEFAFQEIIKESPQLLDRQIVFVLGNIIKKYSHLQSEVAEKIETRRERCHYPCVE
ncbi:MAG: HD domain-containing protein [Acetobacterium sp.]|nr:HD domain-containing protein [Acetobacterium sp.]